MHKSKAYEVLPLVYSHLMRKIRYDIWADYLYSLVKDEVSPEETILELAAGNCVFSGYFKKYYSNIIETDLSLNFLKAAKTDAPKVCCNMLSIPFKFKFKLIYSNFDSVNYLLSIKELDKLFEEVSNVLDDEGMFIFDVSLENNSFRHEKEINRQQRIKGIRFTHRSDYNTDTRIHTNKFIIKLPNGEEFSEIHKQKIYPFNKYFEVISKSDLYVSECFDCFTYKSAAPSSERIQFILRKKQNAPV